MIRSTRGDRLWARTGHVPVPMRRVEDAGLYWLNPRARELDSTFHADIQEPEYLARLRDLCAKRVIDQPLCDGRGYADRYGGGGITHNGGSGRAAFLGAYHVKGVGRTPLIGSETEESHASGDAYLEEATREAIFSEIVDRESPFGVIPVLAIFDAGKTVVWTTTSGPKPERTVLIVRPSFVRPAHFERALGFISSLPSSAIDDAKRVGQMFRYIRRFVGRDDIVKIFDAFFLRWAHQIAYGFVWRMSHSSNTTSNISVDGRLVDFGATSSVPGWQCTATSAFHDSYIGRLANLLAGMRSLSYYFGVHIDKRLANSAVIDIRMRRIEAYYRAASAFETLRLLGVNDSVAAQAVASDMGTAISATIQALIAVEQEVRLDMIIDIPPHEKFDLQAAWSPSCRSSLAPLSKLLFAVVPEGRREEARAAAAIRCADRTALYLPSFRINLYEALRDIQGGFNDRAGGLVASTIKEHVRANLRDVRGSRTGRLLMETVFGAKYTRALAQAESRLEPILDVKL